MDLEELTIEKANQLLRELWTPIKTARKQPSGQETELDTALFIWIRREEERIAAEKAGSSLIMLKVHTDNINKYSKQLQPHLNTLKQWLKTK